MRRTEPAALDLHGATWGPRSDRYVMDPTALRYEQYEISFAAKARDRHHSATCLGCPKRAGLQFKPDRQRREHLFMHDEHAETLEVISV